MADEIKINEFDNLDLMFDILGDMISREIKHALRENKTCNVLLSGGSTPKPLYLSLGKESFKGNPNLHFGLIDERFVDTNDGNSNEKMIKECLGSESDIKGMIYRLDSYEKNLELVNEAYVTFKQRTDLSILGMGTDGHTASIFPGDENSDLPRRSNDKEVYNTNAPVPPIRRITCSKALICDSKIIYLIITGKDKKKVLLDNEMNLPIHDILKQRPDIHIFYADK